MRDVSLLAGRLLLIVLYLVSGLGKWGDLSGTAGAIAAKGLPAPYLLAALAAAAELFGSLAVALGLFPRLSALGLAVYTVVTAFVFHAFWTMPDAAMAKMQSVHFLKNIGLAGGFLLLVGAGPGRYALRRNGRP